jgi:hypothetical protein
MCHHYDREQLTTTPPIGAEDVDEDSGADPAHHSRRADAPPAADD